MIFKFSDPCLSEMMMDDSLNEAERLTKDVLKGKAVGLYSAFKDFREHGVFDIIGRKVPFEDGKISVDGWKQIDKAMEIYRNKKFETFRIVFFDPESREIVDQVAVSSGIPNRSLVDRKDSSVFYSSLYKADQQGLRMILCHNHPSGHTSPSEEDIKLTKSFVEDINSQCGHEAVMGHIILDHDNFSYYDCKEDNWKKIFNEKREGDFLLKEDKTGITGTSVNNTADLFCVARSINDNLEWNKAYIPVVMTDMQNKVSCVAFYYKDFFRQEIPKVKNEMLRTARNTGSVMCFPVLPESFGRGYRDRPEDLHPYVRDLIAHDVFVDGLFKRNGFSRNFSSACDIPQGRSFTDDFERIMDKEGARVESTFSLCDVVRVGDKVQVIAQGCAERERKILERKKGISEGRKRVERKKRTLKSLEVNFLKWAKKNGHKGEVILVNMMRNLPEEKRNEVFSSLKENARKVKAASIADDRAAERNFEVSVNFNVNDRQKVRGRR